MHLKKVMLVDRQSFYRNVVAKKILEKSQGGSYELSVVHTDTPCEDAIIKYFDLKPDLLIWGLTFDCIEEDFDYLKLILEKTDRVIVLLPAILDDVIEKLNSYNIKNFLIKSELNDNLKFYKAVDFFFSDDVSLEDLERYEKEDEICKINQKIQPSRKKALQDDEEKTTTEKSHEEAEVEKDGFLKKVIGIFKK